MRTLCVQLGIYMYVCVCLCLCACTRGGPRGIQWPASFTRVDERHSLIRAQSCLRNRSRLCARWSIASSTSEGARETFLPEIWYETMIIFVDFHGSFEHSLGHSLSEMRSFELKRTISRLILTRMSQDVGYKTYGSGTKVFIEASLKINEKFLM